MNKVAFIYIGNIEICPYIKNYTNILDAKKEKYDVFFWEREKLNDFYPDNYFRFQFNSDPAKKKIYKIFDFIKFFLWLHKQKIGKKYDKVVCLDTLSAILFFFAGKCNAKIAIEIRDYSYEKFILFRLIETMVLKNANKIFISSNAFLEFLPARFDYFLSHNFAMDEYLDRKEDNLKSDISDKIRLVYVGSLKYFNCQKAIVDQLGNDSRFEIYYRGYGPEYIRFVDYCSKHNIGNISISGLYTNVQKKEFYQEADFIINCYDINEGAEVLYALSNKYYDGLIYGIPQLVEADTYKASLVTSYNLGIEWDYKTDGLANRIIEFVNSYNKEKFCKQCESLMNSYAEDNMRYYSVVEDFLK